MYVAGVDIGGTNLKFGVFDENGQPVYTLLRRTARTLKKSVRSAMPRKRATSRIEGSAVCRMVRVWTSSGVPGSVFRPSGKINSGNLKWFGIPFGALLREKTGLQLSPFFSAPKSTNAACKFGMTFATRPA